MPPSSSTRYETSTRYSLSVQFRLQTNIGPQAFVIYCFFNLLLGYLGGERSLLILLHGREPKRSVFPVNLFRKEIDVSDPYMFLFLKRGIIREPNPLTVTISSGLNSSFRICRGEADSSSSNPHFEGCRKVQRRRSASQLRLSLRQRRVQHQHLPKFILLSLILDVYQ